MSITVEKVQNKRELEEIFEIRKIVFVEEQNVSPDEEYDEFEESSTHFIAKLDGVPSGTARWRFTKNGVKLERFAVLKGARGKGVGQALVQAVIDDIGTVNEAKGKLLYMHAQLTAMPLYSKFGFEKVGEIFEECNIMHYQMERYL
ncbi:GNAT family N-acetyltransferase [Belliella kenyensis]|uniref:GNAT family N-acetyltransferase n=1 Tax=Belliella kenyensis TaxID=1472724 RepID=A0ABV8EK78_9BACT|nr:GNAT family N-acetyltransferase [Belliella kenyensis]MCH7402698.1 GNAT family N-acetyltransferase [Belliella kenyensis]MDN3603754.1 GNAT family N-acetyltransferase [Belliella kenyensis]